MFIERSVSRIRCMRTLFVLLAILPCAGLCGWVAVRQSVAYREAIERRCERMIGLPLRIGRIEHVRPHALRLHDCRLSSATGSVVLAVPVIEVESSASEVRLKLESLHCGPEQARVLAGLATQWLRQPVRFPMNCVIDVDDLSWRMRSQPASGPGRSIRSNGLRVECVAANSSRAVRVRREAGAGLAADEIRVMVGPTEAVAGLAAEPAGRLEVTCSLAEPLPLAVIESVAGLEPGTWALGEDACASGAIQAVFEGGLFRGSAQAHIERIDLATASIQLPHRVSGEAMLMVDRLEWSRSRITACECRGAVSRGRVGQPLLDSLVKALGCRPGPAYRSLVRDEVRSFDEASCVVRIDGRGIDLRADPTRSGSLARTQGLSILEEPAAAVPLERLAWLLSPPEAPAVPASRATAWLLGCFSIDGKVDSPAVPPAQAGRPVQRSEF